MAIDSNRYGQVVKGVRLLTTIRLETLDFSPPNTATAVVAVDHTSTRSADWIAAVNGREVFRERRTVPRTFEFELEDVERGDVFSFYAEPEPNEGVEGLIGGEAETPDPPAASIVDCSIDQTGRTNFRPSALVKNTGERAGDFRTVWTVTNTTTGRTEFTFESTDGIAAGQSKTVSPGIVSITDRGRYDVDVDAEAV